jgi:hypothetical protein
MYDEVKSGAQDRVVMSDILQDVEKLPLGVSDDMVVRAAASAFARTPLSSEQLRDIKLVVFLMDVDSGRLDAFRISDRPPLPVLSTWIDRLSLLGGISKARVSAAVQHLFEAQVLVRATELGIGRFDFSAAVLQPLSVAHHVAWQAVMPVLSGHTAPLLLMRAAIDLIPIPWEWSRLTHERLAEHSCYSVGMVQKALESLLDTGVLERSVRVGRGHDYRFSAWALGKAPAARTRGSRERETRTDYVPPVDVRPQAVSTPFAESGVNKDNAVVEVGGVVMQLPAGTQVRMSVDGQGVCWYEIGPDFKIKSRL